MVLMSSAAISQHKEHNFVTTVVINGSSENHRDSMKTSLPYLILNPSNIEEISVIKPASLIAYGEQYNSGAIFIRTKSKVVLIRVNSILDKYKIVGEDRALGVCINNTLVKNPALILADPSEIAGVEITTNRVWIDAKDANSTERFINISTLSRNPIAL
jgi:hypothetical protein